MNQPYFCILWIYASGALTTLIFLTRLNYLDWKDGNNITLSHIIECVLMSLLSWVAIALALCSWVSKHSDITVIKGRKPKEEPK